jgi:hypothetical protein
LTFFHWLGSERSATLRFICSDMWKPYLKVIAKNAYSGHRDRSFRSIVITDSGNRDHSSKRSDGVGLF